jgi:GH15 family glucan-1,4-alpha-glucosidase
MYGMGGERRLWEWEVPWLRGFGNSKPVRIGNAAHGQLQLDVFGELMDALYQARRGGLPASEPTWEMECALLKHLASTWQQPDSGIWEIRAEPRQFTYSKIMAWVAFDRGIRSAQEFKVEGPIEEWRRVRDDIHQNVCANGYDRNLGYFVQAYGSKELDASLLRIPSIGFLPATDERVRSTVEAIERELLVDGFVRRYDTSRAGDGFPPGEGMFLACSFWLADAYQMLGRIQEAEALFERLLGLRNELGLLSEEYDPGKQCLVGNFPQAFSHISLINTAHNLSRPDKSSDQRAGKDVTPDRNPVQP